MGWMPLFLFLLLVQASMQAPKQRAQSKDETMNRSYDDENLGEEANTMQDQDTTSGSPSPNADLEDPDPVNRDASGDNDETENDDTRTDSHESITEEDSVAQAMKKNTVISLPQKEVNSNIHDSVSSYIAREDLNNGILRNKIPESDDNGDTGSESDDIPSPISGADSVASYFDQHHVSGETKHTISSVKPNDKQDSVSSYIDIGSPKNEIVQNEGEDNEPVEETEGLVSTKDSVSPYINLVDHNQHNESSMGSGSKVETASGDAQEEKVSDSSKTQEILEGLEDLTFGGSNEAETHENKKMEELSPDVIKPHRMVGELWQERPAVQTSLPAMYNTTTYPYPYQQQPLYTQPSIQQPDQYRYIDIKFADRKGALCLDGSTPGFFYRQGVGQGVGKWIIYLQGGAWCDSKVNCYNRSKSDLGSSLRFKKLVNVEGILSRDFKANPQYYDWNAVYMPYCDGASYTGNSTKPVVVKGRMIYFRGKRILSALLDDLLGSGLNHAERVIFSGTSAGGLAVLLNADYVRQRIPSNVTHVHSLADAGVFLNIANLKKENSFGKMMHKVFKLHGSSGSINPKCASHQGKANAWKCLFPYYFGKYISSPVFVINPLYDSWQLGNVVGIHCVKNLNKCTNKELKAIVDFRQQTLENLEPLKKNPSIGLFADGCFDHGQIIYGPKWNDIRVKHRSMSGTFTRWTMDEENLKSVIDPDSEEYLFNPTCVTHQVKIYKKSITSS